VWRIEKAAATDDGRTTLLDHESRVEKMTGRPSGLLCGLILVAAFTSNGAVIRFFDD
jgi:hypothetical protein